MGIPVKIRFTVFAFTMETGGSVTEAEEGPSWWSRGSLRWRTVDRQGELAVGFVVMLV